MFKNNVIHRHKKRKTMCFYVAMCLKKTSYTAIKKNGYVFKKYVIQNHKIGQNMLNRKYPTVHYFPTIIESGSVYVDKTQFVVNLLENTAKPSFFLSRPRRFGKSMFVSVL